jgi:hypothetical protein
MRFAKDFALCPMLCGRRTALFDLNLNELVRGGTACAEQDQTRSKSSAMPMPPETHNVTIP